MTWQPPSLSSLSPRHPRHSPPHPRTPPSPHPSFHHSGAVRSSGVGGFCRSGRAAAGKSAATPSVARVVRSDGGGRAGQTSPSRSTYSIIASCRWMGGDGVGWNRIGSDWEGREAERSGERRRTSASGLACVRGRVGACCMGVCQTHLGAVGLPLGKVDHARVSALAVGVSLGHLREHAVVGLVRAKDGLSLALCQDRALRRRRKACDGRERQGVSPRRFIARARVRMRACARVGGSTEGRTFFPYVTTLSAKRLSSLALASVVTMR